MSFRLRGVASTAVAVAVVSAVIGLPSAHADAPTATPTATHEADFNGDGYPDVAFAAPSATVDGKREAGYVGVMYGSADGLRKSSKQLFDQGDAALPGSAQQDAAFGSAVASADLDGDGYDDLIVGAPGADGGDSKSGSLTVLWGGTDGLSSASPLPAGSPDSPSIGGKVVVGDVNGDGDPDVVTTSGDGHLHVLSGPFTRDGEASATAEVRAEEDIRVLDLAAGDIDGDGTDDVLAVVHDGDEYDSRRVSYWRGGSDGLTDDTVIEDAEGGRLQGGEHIATGDVNGDGYADIVVGRAVDGYDSDLDTPRAKGGMITYIPGGADGPVGAQAKSFNQDSPGVPGEARGADGYGNSDAFGSTVSVGDVDGDGYGDIAVGVPGKKVGSAEHAGSVVVLPGGADGPTGSGARSYSQGTDNVPGAAEENDRFGSASKMVDTDGDGQAELLVGTPNENDGAGAVTVLAGVDGGEAGGDSFAFGAGTLGTDPEDPAALGSSFDR